MKAARLHQFNKPLQIDDVKIPEVKGEEVLVRVTGSYVCSSDLGIIDGHMPELKLPLTLGHNNAGYVKKVGPYATGFKEGDPVAILGAWGCGQCRFCRGGEEQLCDLHRWTGFGVDGGYAEYIHVPARRHLIKLDKIDPFDAAPLLDAGLTPYRAVKKTLPYLFPSGAAVILGMGNIGYYAVQIMKAISPGASIIAVDIVKDKLQLASKLGADYVVNGRDNPAEEIKKITYGEGAQAVIDTVGSEATLKTVPNIVGRKAIIMVLGLGNGILPYSFLSLPMECVVTNSVWGSYNEMIELLSLTVNGKVKSQIKHFQLEDINKVFDGMRKGDIGGQAVIVP